MIEFILPSINLVLIIIIIVIFSIVVIKNNKRFEDFEFQIKSKIGSISKANTMCSSTN